MNSDIIRRTLAGSLAAALFVVLAAAAAAAQDHGAQGPGEEEAGGQEARRPRRPSLTARPVLARGRLLEDSAPQYSF
jgi:hypothetical protein